MGLAQDIAKFPQAAIFEDRMALYKSSFPDTCNKFSNMSDNSEYREEILQVNESDHTRLFLTIVFVIF